MVTRAAQVREFAAKVCKLLDASPGWWQTLAIMKNCSDGKDNRQFVRKVLFALEARGVLEKRGTGKYRWRRTTKAINPADPFDGTAPEINDSDDAATGEGAGAGDLGKLTIRKNSILGRHEVTGDKGDTYAARVQLRTLRFSWDEVAKKWWTREPQVISAAVAAGMQVGPGVDANAPATVAPVAQVAVPDLILEQLADLRAQVKSLKEQQKVEIIVKVNEKPAVTIEERVHPVFADVMFHLGCGDNVMLVGPKGCGKTTLCEQVAKAMALEFGMLSLSGGVTESKLFGRSTPNITNGKSEFQPGAFAESFETGGLFLLDEVDAADPNVLLSINSALANGVLALDRPKKPLARKAKNFVCMAAANTWGNGADRQYVGRNQQDGAFVERFHQIEMGYDEALERSLCPGQEKLVTMLHQFRARVVANKLERTISTRFICRAANWMNNGKDLEYVKKCLFAGWRRDEVAKVNG